MTSRFLPEVEEVDLSTMYPERADPDKILGEHETVLLYGPGGTGKTHTLLTAPKPIWILTPGGPNEIKPMYGPSFIKKHGKVWQDVYFTSVREDREKGQMKDNPTGYDRCCDAVDAFLEWNDKMGIGTATIAADNATRTEEYMMNKAIMAEFHLASTKEKTTLTREREYGIRRPGDNTYGGAQSFMDRWINWLTELPFHLVFIAHDYETYTRPSENSRETVLKSVKPLFVGAQRTSVPNKFDNVWYSMTQGGGRSQTWQLKTVRDEIMYAKTRVGGIFNEYVRDPNLSEMIGELSLHAKAIKEGMDYEADTGGEDQTPGEVPPGE